MVHSRTTDFDHGWGAVPVTTMTKAETRDSGLVRAVMGALVLLALGVTVLVAQDVPDQLTLEDAIRLAKENNPIYLSTRNDVGTADWQVREAYGAFLPDLRANAAAAYTEAGIQRIGTLDFGAQSTDWYSSNYSLSMSWTLNGNTLFGVQNARASRRATEALVEAAEFNLESMVALQYMATLRMRDGVDVAQRQLDRARQNFQIVRARVSSGASAGTDGKQAEVELGRAEVGLIQAQRQQREAGAMLAEQVGIIVYADEVRLASEFTVFEPTWDREALIQQALTNHPSLNAAQAQLGASKAAVRQAASQYFPTLTFTTAVRGNTLQALNQEFISNGVISQQDGLRSNCEFMNALNAGLTQPLPGFEVQNCSGFVATNAMIQGALDKNASFPWDFTKTPISFALNISIPVFTGFTRQRQMAQAREAAEDAAHSQRAEELRLRTAVTQAYDNLVVQHQVIQLEERNRQVAEEQLQLQQRRYALGAAALLELMDAQTTVSTADQAYLNALYDFHWNLIRLEAAVGQPLRSR